MLRIAAGVCALLVRGQIAYAVPILIATLGSRSGLSSMDRHRRRTTITHGSRRADLHQLWGGGVFRGQRPQDPLGCNDHYSLLLRGRRSPVCKCRLFRQRIAELGVLNDGLDDIKIDSFLEILIRGRVSLWALV